MKAEPRRVVTAAGERVYGVEDIVRGEGHNERMRPYAVTFLNVTQDLTGVLNTLRDQTELVMEEILGVEQAVDADD